MLLFFWSARSICHCKASQPFLKHKENIILSFDWKTEPAVINNQNLRLTSEPDFWVLFSMVSTFSPTLMF